MNSGKKLSAQSITQQPKNLPGTLPNYAELHCLSNFSFLRGASKPSELIERAKASGYSALALTDECSFAGVVRAYKAAKAANFKLIIGSEFVFDDGLKLVLLAQNRAGYGNLAALITLARRRSEKGRYRLTRGDIDVLPSLTAPSGAVPDCLVLWVPPQICTYRSANLSSPFKGEVGRGMG